MSKQECLVHGMFEHTLQYAIMVGLEGAMVMERSVELVPWMTCCRCHG